MILQKIGIFVAAMLFATVSVADTLDMQENHPTKYVVKKGDTLWDISGKFLKKPWYWPKIWNVNPQIDDPHWIYPGDVLTLVWIDGKPYLQKAVSAQTNKPIPTIDAKAIKTFLKHDQVLPFDDNERAKIPYVLGENDAKKVIAETGDIYVRGSLAKGTQYAIYRKGPLLKDEAGRKLGYQAVYSGALVAGEGNGTVTKALLVKNVQEVMPGDYVMPFNNDDGYDLYFVPKPAQVETSVLALGNLDYNLAGRNDTVVLGKGSKDGVSTGDVFAISKTGKGVVGHAAEETDYYEFSTAGKQFGADKNFKLPDDVVGQAMVYKTYDNVSLAIILTAQKSVGVGYKAGKPE